MLLSIFAGMLGDLVFLPALLSWFPAVIGSPKLSIPSVETPSLSQWPPLEEVLSDSTEEESIVSGIAA